MAEEKINRRNLLKSALVSGLAGLVLLAGCDLKENENKAREEKEFTLRVSEGTSNRISPIVYCGMLPDEKHFSLAYYGYSAVNYYYSKDSKQIYFCNSFYDIISVDPNKITLKLVAKEKEKEKN